MENNRLAVKRKVKRRMGVFRRVRKLGVYEKVG